MEKNINITNNSEERSSFKPLTAKPTGKRPLVRSIHRWEDSIRMDLNDIDIITRNWIDSAQVRDFWRAIVNAGHISHGVTYNVQFGSRYIHLVIFPK
jgi:hypothetical protein